MGGYASEQIVFKDVSTGASNDLKEATKMSKNLVTKYGMSEKLGPVTYNGSHDAVFLGREMGTEKDHSEHIAAEIDKEVSKFMHAGHKLAKKIITSRRKVLNAIAEALIQKETLEQEEFDALMKKFGLKQLAVTAAGL